MSNSWVNAWRGPWLAAVISSVALSGCKLPDELLLPPADSVSPVQLTIGEFDTNVRAGEYANVSVSYADLDTSVYSLHVEITNGSYVASSVVSSASSAAGTLTLKMPVKWSTPAGNNYYVSVTADSNSDRNASAVVMRKDKPITVTVPVPAPVVSMSSVPQQVAAGTFLNVVLNQSSVNFATHKLTVFLAKGLDHVGEVQVPATTPAQSTIKLPVHWNAAPGSGYVVGWEVARLSSSSSDVREMNNDDVGAAVTVTAPSIPAPTAVFESADSQVQAGSVAKARLKFSNVPSSATHDFIAYVLGASDTRIEVPIVATGAGTVDVALPVPLTTPAGSFIWSWAVVAKAQGWANPMTAYVEDTQHMIQVSAPGSVVPSVTLSGIPTTVTAGDYMSVTLSHQNVDFSKYKLVLNFVNGAGVYEEVEVPAAASGTRVIKIPVPWRTAAADNIVVGWALTSLAGGANDPTNLSQELTANPVTIVVATTTAPTLTISANYPKLMNAGEFADVNVTYSGFNFATHKLYVGVRNVVGTVGLVEITSGQVNATQTVSVPIWWDATPGGDYYVELAAIDTLRDGWSDPKTIRVTADSPAITVKADPPMPTISITGIPQTVKSGEYLTLNVNHVAVNNTTHELIVYLHSAELPDIEATVAVGANDGTTTVKLPIQWAAPVGMEFQVEWVLLQRTKGIDDLRSISHLYEESVIQVTAATATPPSLSFASFDATVQAGSSVNAAVDYSGVNFTTHDLFAAIVNDDGVIAGLTQITQPTSGHKNLQIPVSGSAPAGPYNIVLAALPRSGKSVAERVSDPMAAIVAAPTGTVQVTSSQPPAAVTFVTYDHSVKAGEYLNATINYQNIVNDTHELVVYVAGVGGHFEVPVAVTGAGNVPVSGTATVKLPIPWTATASNSYALGWGAISREGSWGDPRSLYREVPGVAIEVQAPSTTAPELQINSYATSVKAGAVFSVGVYFKDVNFATHDVNVDLTDGSEVYGRTYTSADALSSSETKNVQIEIPAAAPAGNTYYVQMSVVSKTGGWNDPKSISVIARTPSVTITH